MPNPLSYITPAIDLLGKNLNILPAVGNAVEDLQHPDQDEIEDTLINREVEQVTTFAETPAPSIHNIYRATPPLYRREKHLFRFFIDGSLRTYYLGTAIEGTRSFPIELAQIGSAVLQRYDNGRLKRLDSRHKVLLLIPGPSGGGLSDTVWAQLQQLQPQQEVLEIIDITTRDVISGEQKVDLRNKAGGKARHRMHELEISLIKSTEELRSEGSWLILDGAVKLDDFIKAPYLIGVAKSFRKDPQFYFGRGMSSRKDVTGILAGLPHAHRTVAFSAHNGQVAFWYVRLREQKEVDYPLMGVVKVEFPCPGREPVDAELADLISRALVGEKNVTPYGTDRRWHCHLYPIFTAEQVIKNRFFSQEVLLGCIRWPKPMIA